MKEIKEDFENRINQIKVGISVILIDLEGISLALKNFDSSKLMNDNDFSSIWNNQVRLKEQKLKIGELILKIEELELYESDFKKIVNNKNLSL